MMKAGVIVFLICAFMLPSYVEYEKSGNNCFTIILNGMTVGTVSNEELIDSYLVEARKQLVADSEDLVLIETELAVEGSEIVWGELDTPETIIDNMKTALKTGIKETLHRSYTVKINEAAVNLNSYEDVQTLLEAALNQYDLLDEYDAALVLDGNREVNVLTPQVYEKEAVVEEEVFRDDAGVEAALNDMFEAVEPTVEKDFDDYKQGLIGIDFADKIEIVEAYLPEEELIAVQEAIDLVTKEQEVQLIYKVASGDTLSQISLAHNIPIDDLIAMNPGLEDENTILHIDDEIIITMPEPDLSVSWKEEQVIVEDYEAEVQYVYNDNWYTTKQVTLQQPSAGRRKVVAVTEYLNGKEVAREIIKEEVYAEAVPKIVEKGTIIPPTYIKPINGGRLSSKFGRRSAPVAGASTYHKGVDWAVATGTPVYASNAGTVSVAGWVSGYGYAVYINHSDGRQTRYGHCSKVLVKPGQKVAQGERIALSGNTGRSSGPHLHFEIRIGGTAVDPLKYLD